MSRVSYQLEAGVAHILMDDGKANVMSPEMQAELRNAFDRAETDRAVVLLSGRPGMFCAGFDLNVLRGPSPAEAGKMVRGGFELAEQILSFPYPVVMATSGHAVAMGVFLLLLGDYRIGAEGSYRLSANEVAIGLTVPLPAIAILRHRLTPAAFERAACLADVFSPSEAVHAGFLHRIVAPDQLQTQAQHIASTLTALDMQAHAATKRRCRETLLAEIRAGIAEDYGAP